MAMAKLGILIQPEFHDSLWLYRSITCSNFCEEVHSERWYRPGKDQSLL